jgi:hypothetical protein
MSLERLEDEAADELYQVEQWQLQKEWRPGRRARSVVCRGPQDLVPPG